jgi:hypothetical protein
MIRLPAPREYQPQGHSRARRDAALKGLRVMIIDDNFDAADSVAMLAAAAFIIVRRTCMAGKCITRVTMDG